MPRFDPVTAASALPPVGAGSEHALWDLKKRLPPEEFKNARNIAAFANHLGGTLLVGAEDDGTGQVRAYHPMTATETDQAETDLARAVENRCQPRPLINYARIAHDGGIVLAVNVWPVISAPVGVSIKADKSDGYGGTAYAFPIRLGHDTAYLSSDNLPMHMMPELRRTLILLASIPTGEPVLVVRRGHRSDLVYTIHAIDEASNTIKLHPHPVHRAHEERWAPLDCVLHVSKRKPGDGGDGANWQITIAESY